jgi:hypothetical protein
MAPPLKVQPPKPITVDGVAYVWSVRRMPQYSAEHGWVGLVITVEPAVRPQRVLVIEYPMPADWTPAGPMARRIARPPITDEDFPAQIRAAIEAGWDPGARGKPFNYVVGVGGMRRR